MNSSYIESCMRKPSADTQIYCQCSGQFTVPSCRHCLQQLSCPAQAFAGQKAASTARPTSRDGIWCKYLHHSIPLPETTIHCIQSMQAHACTQVYAGIYVLLQYKICSRDCHTTSGLFLLQHRGESAFTLSSLLTAGGHSRRTIYPCKLWKDTVYPTVCGSYRNALIEHSRSKNQS